jgi:GNAT superfamily N-acetyltransferase
MLVAAPVMPVTIRLAEKQDVHDMAAVRARESNTQEFWEFRIGGYIEGTYSPQQALAERIALVAFQDDALAGFAAGHRTRRLDCTGELQWLNVAEQWRGRGIAGELLAAMGEWFARLGAVRVCVNVDPANAPARALYAKFGAVPLQPAWMVWEDARAMKLARP